MFSKKERVNVPPENRKIGIVFQDYAVWPHMSVYDNVAYPLKKRKVPKAEIAKRVSYALEQSHMTGYENYMPSQLSGGQQQRVSIARALAGSPSVILADEPTGALDSRTGREVLSFLKQLNREGDTVVLITHDNSIAVRADRIIRLQDGRIIYDGDAHDPRAVVQPDELPEADIAEQEGAV